MLAHINNKHTSRLAYEECLMQSIYTIWQLSQILSMTDSRTYNPYNIKKYNIIIYKCLE